MASNVMSADNLEIYVNNVRNLSQQGNYTGLSEMVGKSIDMLSKQAAHLNDAMDTFDMQQHSLGVLGILVTKYNLVGAGDIDPLFVKTQEFVATCNGEQIRYAKDLFADLCHKLAQHLIDRKQAIRGISMLKRAVQKIQLFSSQLTSIHADLCQLCLVSKCMQPAIELLDIDITDISKESGQYDAKHFLLYYYYGGMIYTALKKYDRALFFFEIVITTPSMAVSHIMLEAYKKYILVSLILHGKISTLPRYTSHIVTRYIKPLCQAYQDLATVYVANNRHEIMTSVTTHTDLFVRDRNMGLIKQCITAMYKKNIQRLTKTFMTLSLTDMANRVQLSGPREAEKYVLHMIENGEIFATINQKDGMVSFHDNPEKYNSVETMCMLDKQMAQSMELVHKLQEMDREITVNPLYVQKSCGLMEDEVGGSNMKLPVGHVM
jgi:COP9 signalosome complex subunit 3